MSINVHERWRAWIAAVVASCLALVSAENLRAATLSEAVDRLADKVTKYLTARNENSIVVGSFAGPPASGTGLKIKKEFREALQKKKISCDAKVGRQLRGDYRHAKREKKTVVVLSAKMIDFAGNEVADFREQFETTEEIDKQEDVAVLLGASVDFKSEEKKGESSTESKSKPTDNGTPGTSGSNPSRTTAIEPLEVVARRESKLTESVEHPQVSIRQAADSSKSVFPDKNSPYAIQIKVRNKETGRYELCPATDESGYAFVDLQVGQEFAVILRNDSEYDVGVKLTLDGLSMFEFSEIREYKRLDMVFIRRKSTGFIRGWHVTNESSDAFRVTHLPQSEAAKLGQDSNPIGTITAIFFPAWRGDQVHPDELLGKARSSTGKGIERGPQVEQTYETVPSSFGSTLLASVSVRYNRPDEDLPPKE